MIEKELKNIFNYLQDFIKCPFEYNDDGIALLKAEQVVILLEYTSKLQQENQQLKEQLKQRDEELRDYKKGYSNLTQALNEIRKVINGEEFFSLMNSETNTHHCSKDKVICEDYFKGKELISKIIDKVDLGDDKIC